MFYPNRGGATPRRNGGPGPRPGFGLTHGWRGKRGGRGGISHVAARPQTGNAECWVVSHNNGRRSYYTKAEAEDALGRYRAGECICCGRHDMPANAEFSSDSEPEQNNTITHTSVVSTSVTTTTNVVSTNGGLDYTVINTGVDNSGLPPNFIFNPNVFYDINDPIVNYFEDDSVPVVNDTDTDTDSDNDN